MMQAVGVSHAMFYGFHIILLTSYLHAKYEGLFWRATQRHRPS